MRWLKPWSASSGAQKSASTTPATSSPKAASARSRVWLFRNDVLKARPREDGKNKVVQAEKGQVTSRFAGHRRPNPADDDRDAEGQEQKWEQELAGGGARPR